MRARRAAESLGATVFRSGVQMGSAAWAVAEVDGVPQGLAPWPNHPTLRYREPYGDTGPRRPEQVDGVIGAAAFRLSEEEIAEIERAPSAPAGVKQ